MFGKIEAMKLINIKVYRIEKKNILSIKRAVLVLFLCIMFLSFFKSKTVKADWNNDATDFFDIKGYSKARYIENSFWFGDRGRIGNSYKYRVIGWQVNVNVNGNWYKVYLKNGTSISNVSSENAISDGINYGYDLYSLGFNTIMNKLRQEYPSVNFDGVYDRSIDTTFKFDAIGTLVQSGWVRGSIDSEGNSSNWSHSGLVYTDSNSFVNSAQDEWGFGWADYSKEDIRSLFNIYETVPANQKPELPAPSAWGTIIEPNRPGWPINLPTTHYHVNGSEEYWVNLRDKFTIYVESSINKSEYGDNSYPDYNYIMLQGNGSDNKSYSKSGTNNGGSQDGFTNNFDQIDNSSWGSNTNNSNYLISNFKMRATKDNKDYRFGYTAVKNQKYNEWKDSGLWLKTDGTAPKIEVYSSTYENVWTKDDIEVEWSSDDERSGLKTTKHWLKKDDGELVWKGENISEITLNTSGRHDVVVEAIDNVNNTTGQISKKYLIDKTNPLGDVSVENVTTTGFDVVVKNISDAHSGVDKVSLGARTTESYDDTLQEKAVSKDTSSVTFRVNTSDYDNKCGTYYFDVSIFDKVENERKSTHSVNVPYPKPVVSPIEISNHEYKDTSNNIYWVKTDNPYTAKVFGKTNPANVRYKIDSLHALVRKLGSTDFSKMRAFDAHIPNYEEINSKCYDFSMGTNTLYTSTTLGDESYSLRLNDGFTYSYFDLLMSSEEDILINPMVRISEINSDSDWNYNSVIVKSDGTAPNGKVEPYYDENKFDLDINVGNVVEKGSGVSKIWVEYFPVDNEERKVYQDLVNLNGIYRGKKNLFDLFPDSISPVGVVVKAKDNVGNERELFKGEYDPFKIEATINRAWAPYESIFKEGEKGVVKVKVYGGIESVKIEFSTELTELDYRLDTSIDLDPKKKDSTDYVFFVPIGAENKIYEVKVTGYKNGKEKFAYPTMEVRGNILSEIRTRIR